VEPLQIDLLLHAEALAGENPYPREFAGAPLWHQVATGEALRQAQVVVNSFPTGTGKTRAALLGLLQRADGDERWRRDALGIAIDRGRAR